MKEKEINEIEEQLKQKKIIPEEIEENLRGKVIKEIWLANLIMVYFTFLNLGFINIEKQAFYTDLKVFSISLLMLAIVLFERSYKKERGDICIYGIEALVIGIITLFSIHAFQIYINFTILISFLSFIIATYYCIKACIVYQKGKNKYYIENMSKITKN